MPFARLTSTIRLITAAVLLGTLTIAGWAQDAPAAPVPQNTPETRPLPVLNYSKPVSHFPNPIGPYTPRHLAAPNLANTARIDQLMHDGKLYLSLNDAIALALENNLDIAIARYNLNIADTDVLRAKAGASTLGVNTGVVQNTPGGGVGGLGGQVGSGTGGHHPRRGRRGRRRGRSGGLHARFRTAHHQLRSDPHWHAAGGPFPYPPFQYFYSRIPRTPPPASFSYQQGFSWGTNLPGGFNNTRIATGNAPFNSLSPQLNSSFQLPTHPASAPGIRSCG